jgi:hypothetical protein
VQIVPRRVTITCHANRAGSHSIITMMMSDQQQQVQQDDYHSMYEESRDMLLASTLVYVFAKLRNLGRKSLLSDDDWNTIKFVSLVHQNCAVVRVVYR